MLLMLLALAVALVEAAGSGLSCPQPFVDLGLGEQRCYYFSRADDARSWTEAYVQCATLLPTASLLSVPDAVHFYPVPYQVRLTNATQAWTGLLNVGGQHSWADETTFNPQLEQFIAADDARSWLETAYGFLMSVFSMWSTSHIFGYVSTQDGMFHFGNGDEKRPYVCVVDLTPPPSPSTSTSPAPPVSSTPTPSPCNAPWTENGGRCYLMSVEIHRWSEAAHGCHQRAAELVSIGGGDTLLFLLLQTGAEHYWTGLQEENGTFIWEDGTDASGVQRTLGPYMDAWQPSKNCLLLDAAAYPRPLVHADCFDSHFYICYTAANTTRAHPF